MSRGRKKFKGATLVQKRTGLGKKVTDSTINSDSGYGGTGQGVDLLEAEEVKKSKVPSEVSFVTKLNRYCNERLAWIPIVLAIVGAIYWFANIVLDVKYLKNSSHEFKDDIKYNTQKLSEVDNTIKVQNIDIRNLFESVRSLDKKTTSNQEEIKSLLVEQGKMQERLGSRNSKN